MNLPIGPIAGVSVALLFTAIRQSCKRERERNDLSARAYLERSKYMENMRQNQNLEQMRTITNAQLKSYLQNRGISAMPISYDQATMANMITQSGR
jgi:hypothetical protein